MTYLVNGTVPRADTPMFGYGTRNRNELIAVINVGSGEERINVARENQLHVLTLT